MFILVCSQRWENIVRFNLLFGLVRHFGLLENVNIAFFLSLISEKDWEDIKFGVDNEVDFYAVSFVKDAQVVRELKAYLKGNLTYANKRF